MRLELKLQVPVMSILTGNAKNYFIFLIWKKNMHKFIFFHIFRFERLDTATPTHCDTCTGVLWGPVKSGVRCVDCGHVCHEKCVDSGAKNCTKYKTVGSDNMQNHTLTRSGADSGSVSSSKKQFIFRLSLNYYYLKMVFSSVYYLSIHSGVSTLQTSSQQYYDQFSSNVAENRTHEGYLYKRGLVCLLIYP